MQIISGIISRLCLLEIHHITFSHEALKLSKLSNDFIFFTDPLTAGTRSRQNYDKLSHLISSNVNYWKLF